jgi:hypothetical protein
VEVVEEVVALVEPVAVEVAVVVEEEVVALVEPVVVEAAVVVEAVVVEAVGAAEEPLGLVRSEPVRSARSFR